MPKLQNNSEQYLEHIRKKYYSKSPPKLSNPSQSNTHIPYTKYPNQNPYNNYYKAQNNLSSIKNNTQPNQNNQTYRDSIEENITPHKELRGTTHTSLKPNPHFNVLEHWAQQLLKCPITPSVKKENPFKPKVKIFSNNLVRVKNNLKIAQGEIIIIKGVITDINCIPIPNAVVEIWHTDNKGTFFNERNNLPKSSYDALFAGSGLITTNNLGEFEMISIMPTIHKHSKIFSAPKIHISVSHANFNPIETEIFFMNHPENQKDTKFLTLSLPDQNSLTALAQPNPKTNQINNIYFEITLDGINHYKKY